MRLAINRPRLGATGSLVDMLVRSEVQAHSAMPKLMSKLVMPTGCSIECRMHLGISWGSQNFQVGVSLDARESGEVSLPKEETC